MKLIVGLGNNGKEYENTRHNLGFLVIDELAKDLNIKFKEEGSAYYGSEIINGEKVILAKPKLFMNNSGQVVKGMLNYFKIDIENLFVIQDDKDQEVGSFKIVKSSGHGGQNGIKDIINHLNSNEFVRLKVGIGSNPQIDTSHYVLGKWTKEQIKIINNLKPTFVNIAKDFIEEDFISLSNKYNGTK